MEEIEKEGDLLLPQERRDYPRIAITVAIHYRILNNDEADKHLSKHFDPEKIFHQYEQTSTINMSTSGLLMYCAEEIPLKSFVAVSMYIPLPGLSCACKALAEVIRCDKEDGKYKIGVKFLKILWHNLNKFRFVTLTDLLNIKGEDIKID
jgi:hypothetical protein